ncbi:MAG TPA: hypothetical protein VD973_28455 [Symbiobacteriaceae bacterium]|jgi:hypothetical protein|nr:hypothetical protein [Symbiobacteriaceae bacterium]
MIAFVETQVQSLPEKIRARMAGGAGVWEVTGMELPEFMNDAVGSESVEAAFVSRHALVAVLGSGKTVVKRIPASY